MNVFVAPLSIGYDRCLRCVEMQGRLFEMTVVPSIFLNKKE